MLTRLKISGFKNLVDVDVRFGPFTCIAGPNGVGKSNLFDAIRFLSALADKPLIEAAFCVRDEGGRTTDLRSIFHRAGKKHDQFMTFEAEMIVPAKGIDDLGQEAKATITFLRYTLILRYREGSNHHALGALELVKEELAPIRITQANKHILFPHSRKDWREQVVTGKRSGGPFISTEGEEEARIIKLHQDGGSRGRPLDRSAGILPRTVLSAVNAAESPTALLARREMQSWRLLQLEPSALRQPDPFTAPRVMDHNGAHLAATLYHLAHTDEHDGDTEDDDRSSSAVYTRVANRLAELIADVRGISVDRDEKRELFTVAVRDEHGTAHAAKALSDGTLRFLALAVVEADPNMKGVLCLEEPENGIHPERIPAMLSLLQDIATDPSSVFDPSDPLRQIIVNTHSPAVVGQIDDDCLLLAESKEFLANGVRARRAVFSALSDTWRSKRDPSTPITSLGKVLAYLNPTDRNQAPEEFPDESPPRRRRRRIIDRDDVAQYRLWPANGE